MDQSYTGLLLMATRAMATTAGRMKGNILRPVSGEKRQGDRESCEEEEDTWASADWLEKFVGHVSFCFGDREGGCRERGKRATSDIGAC